MDFRLFSMKCAPLLAVAALMAASSSEAQRSATNAWQKIIFSSPDNTEISSNLTSDTTQPSSSGLQNQLRIFQDSSPVAGFDSPPLAAAPAPMPNQARRFQKTSAESQQWEFMTPAEILGVTPDQILQNQKRNANDGQASLTPLERSLEGQNPSVRLQAASFFNSSPARNFWANRNGETNDIISSLFSGSLRDLQSKTSGRNAPSANWFGGPNEDSDWSKMFGVPPSSPDQNPAQQQKDDMKQFMQLLNRDFAPTAAATTSPDAASSDSDSIEPLADPIGNSFAPLSSGIGKPTGLASLPTITRQAIVEPVAPPAWAPQPPPWLSPTPQPFAVPQRKF